MGNQLNSVKLVSDSFLCSNCGACFNVCSRSAITMRTSSIGRMYASVSADCINCGLCLNVCPSIIEPELHKQTFGRQRFLGEIISCYVGRASDQFLYDNSQSGGVCTAVLKFLFESREIDAAVVCKMEYGNPPVVKSFIATNIEDLYGCQKSCYTPVNLLSALKEVSGFESVAIVGLPCHIQGVVNLQHILNRFSNIKYKLGLICDRTLCSGIQKLFCNKYGGGKDVKIDWRHKNFWSEDKLLNPLYGRIVHEGVYKYQNAPVVLFSKSGLQKVIPNKVRFALKDMFTPPRCRVCYDKMNTQSDITFGDPWGMTGIDWEKGQSLILSRNSVGQNIIAKMIKKNVIAVSDRDVDEVYEGQFLEQRQKQVSVYSRVFSSFQFLVNSYILNQESEIIPDSNSIRIVKIEFHRFIKMDEWPFWKIRLYASKVIFEYGFSRNVLLTFFHKVKFKVLGMICRN